MTTDWRALCAELTDALHNAIRVIPHEDGILHISTAEPVLDRARAALAEPEPEGPTVMEIIELADEIEAAELGQVDLVQAALARWGHEPAPPAEGEVTELAAWLRMQGEAQKPGPNSLLSDRTKNERHTAGTKLTRAADLLQQLSAAAPVAAPAAGEQRHPTPVPVAERLPGPEDCDAGGRCWAWDWLAEKWCLCDRTSACHGFDHWLPATALPLPAGEVEPNAE